MAVTTLPSRTAVVPASSSPGERNDIYSPNAFDIDRPRIVAD